MSFTEANRNLLSRLQVRERDFGPAPTLATRVLPASEYKRIAEANARSVIQTDLGPMAIRVWSEDQVDEYVKRHRMTRVLASKGIHDPRWDTRFVVVVSDDFPL